MSAAVAAKVEEKKSHESRAAAPVVGSVGPTGARGATAGLPLFLQTQLIAGTSGDTDAARGECQCSGCASGAPCSHCAEEEEDVRA